MILTGTIVNSAAIVAGSIAVAILVVSTIFRLVTAQNGKSRK